MGTLAQTQAQTSTNSQNHYMITLAKISKDDNESNHKRNSVLLREREARLFFATFLLNNYASLCFGMCLGLSMYVFDFMYFAVCPYRIRERKRQRQVYTSMLVYACLCTYLYVYGCICICFYFMYMAIEGQRHRESVRERERKSESGTNQSLYWNIRTRGHSFKLQGVG